jgi:hypothetical protein
MPDAQPCQGTRDIPHLTISRLDRTAPVSGYSWNIAGFYRQLSKDRISVRGWRGTSTLHPAPLAAGLKEPIIQRLLNLVV